MSTVIEPTVYETPQALIRAVADVFRDRPQAWQQQEWGSRNSCGTTGCIAGWAVVLTHGAEIPFVSSDSERMVEVWRADRSGPCPTVASSGWCTCEPRCVHIEEYAATLLDLGEDDAEYLFHGEWTPDGAEYDDDGNVVWDGEHPVVVALERLAAGETPRDVGHLF